MSPSVSNSILIRQPGGGNSRRCMACGAALNGRKRRYCSASCCQTLLLTLDRRTGLLQALNTRYATFYFNDWLIVMDLLTHGTEQIYSFMLPRRQSEEPYEKFRQLANMLGNAWWAEMKRTHKRYLASRHILETADRSQDRPEKVIPVEIFVPTVKGAALTALDLGRTDLSPDNLAQNIKRAYRRQVKKHHPDLGGDVVSFRRIQDAYERLIEWSRHPRFSRRNGFPDRWFYDSHINRWTKPTPEKATGSR